MEVSQTVAVACCQTCLVAVNEYADQEAMKQILVSTIEARHRATIAFTASNEARLLIKTLPPIVTAKDMARGTYNRRDPNYGKWDGQTPTYSKEKKSGRRY